VAISVVHKFAEETNALPSPWITSNSLAAVNNRLYILTLYAVFDETTFTTVTGAGLTWVKISSASFSDVTNFQGGAMFRALVTSGATTGALTIAVSPSSSRMYASVEEFDGIDTSGTNGSGAIVQSNASFGGSPATSSSVTLSAFGSGSNVALSYVGKTGSSAFTPDASNGGYTELVDMTDSGTDGRFQTQWNTGSDTAVTTSWTTGANWGSGATEIQWDGIVPTPPSPIRRVGQGRRAGN
jgi:hypothetical protein